MGCALALPSRIEVARQIVSPAEPLAAQGSALHHPSGLRADAPH